MNLENRVYPEITIKTNETLIEKELEKELEDYKQVIEQDFKRLKKYQW